MIDTNKNKVNDIIVIQIGIKKFQHFISKSLKHT